MPGAIPYEFAGDRSLATLVDAWQRAGRVGSIVGPHGTGKSTLVASLVRHLESTGARPVVVTLHDGQATLPAGAIVRAIRRRLLVVDGAEQLGRSGRKILNLLVFFGVGLWTTAHAPIGLPVLHETHFDRAFVHRFAGRLGVTSRSERAVDTSDIDAAIDRSNGNVREVLLRLYDHYERAASP